MSKEKKEKAEQKRFHFANHSITEQREGLEAFARGLRRYLESPEQSSENKKKKIMDEVAKKMGVKKLDVRQFDSFLKYAYDEGYLRLGYHRLLELAYSLSKKSKFGELQGITVVAGTDPAQFEQAAAEDFIKRIFEIGNMKKEVVGRTLDEIALNVGIVSGSTTGAVIRAAMNLDWKKDLKVTASDLPGIRVFPLNVCLTTPEHLSGNASILAYQLAEKINSEAHKEDLARAYGLSAPLLVEKERLEEVDKAPQTFDVLQFTEPYRVRSKLNEIKGAQKELNPTDTELDIVLTGVGELPLKPEDEQHESGGSIFYNLAKEFEFDMRTIIEEERIVGDIAFTAIRGDGEAVTLRKNNKSDKQKKTEYVFYSAVQLHVLDAMARDNNKSVILVARHGGEDKYKVPSIFASISGVKHRYASRLVIDEITASRLDRF